LKKNRTIFQQLLLNILLPVFGILLIFSSISYYLNKQKLQESYLKERNQVTNEVKSLLTLYDNSLQLIEEDLDQEITRINHVLNNNYFYQTDSISTANLSRIQLEANIDSNAYDIYIIDRNGVITNTTFEKDLGLAFYKIDNEFKVYFEKIWASKKLNIDRLGGEMSTRKIKKYSYCPTRDGKYIIELGAYSKDADRMKERVDQQIEEVKTSFPELDDIQSFIAIENFNNTEIPENHQKQFQEALDNKTSVRVSEEKDNLNIYYDYIYIEMPGAIFYGGYILLIQSNNSREKALLKSELLRFSWMTLGTIIPLSLIVYFRSRKIIKPIKTLNEKVRIISQGKLNERVPEEGSREIKELSTGFNKMVNELEDLYEGLEQKVKERTTELQHQKEIVEEKQKEIIDSINYAKRLQDAILPPKKLIDDHLKENFVLFKPKDIVAGDFYWAEKIGNHFFIAAADCTGHGVPGAMVSVVCSNALNRSVKEFGMLEPGKILDKTTDLVLETFEKSDEDVKDGMDISLLAVTFRARTKNQSESESENESENESEERVIESITWSGANNPLWYIENGEMKELKADKQPIGKSDHRKPFTTHTLPLSLSAVFLFTDGYADQFGGAKGKKFKYKPFMELLQNHSSLSMEEQKNKLDNAIENWKGDLEQNDDICIIGIKI
jgi:sigma-B regulation protein RsbU (phosphoserine phosphatase)